VAFADRDFINANGTEIVGDRFPIKKAFHISHLHPMNLLPAKTVYLSHTADGHLTA
jgi:hypothetical protein